VGDKAVFFQRKYLDSKKVQKLDVVILKVLPIRAKVKLHKEGKEIVCWVNKDNLTVVR